MNDRMYGMRSLWAPTSAVPDEYADGKAAEVYELFIGSRESRTSHYKDWLLGTLTAHGCETILDVACGTGVDSSLLVDCGYAVTSTDASDKMLKFALKERWEKRADPKYDKWVIEEANWLTLTGDLANIVPEDGGWDAVICLGNSFAHLPDFYGNLQNQRLALSNMRDLLKPGGILILDHRNFDAILDSGKAPSRTIYHNSDHFVDIKTSILYVNGHASLVTHDYKMDITKAFKTQRFVKEKTEEPLYQTFSLSGYPHRLKPFTTLLKEVFGEHAKHEVLGDFKQYDADDIPSYFVHLVVKDQD